MLSWFENLVHPYPDAPPKAPPRGFLAFVWAATAGMRPWLLGMTLLRRKDFPEGRFSLAFVGYGAEIDHAVIELTHNWDQPGAYELGTGYGHIAIAVEDIYAVCDELKARGAKIIREAGPMKNDTLHLAFVQDPDGYKIELIDAKTVAA